MANTYTAIKRDTTFPIEVGGNTLINLQKLLLYVIEGKTEEEITKKSKKKLQKMKKIAFLMWARDFTVGKKLAFLYLDNLYTIYILKKP